MNCKECGAVFSDEAAFCPMCGKPVERGGIG
ncbi:zinc-ribbon domain-containing protein [Anaerovoracaceae bacterium 41-7]